RGSTSSTRCRSNCSGTAPTATAPATTRGVTTRPPRRSTARSRSGACSTPAFRLSSRKAPVRVPYVGQTGTLDKAATAAGRLILEALEEERPARSLSRLSDSPRAVRLLRELFTVAVRRSFVGRESRDVTGYVRDLLDYQSLKSDGELAREA